MSDEIDKKAVVFIDSMGDDDLEHMDFVREELRTGTMDAGPVYVTPVVLGSIYTGLSPTDHGLPAVSRYDQAPRLRPAAPTIPELAAASEAYENVMQKDLPFIVPQNVEPNGNYWHSSEAMGQVSFTPAEAQGAMTTIAPGGALDKPGENLDLAFNLRVDHCMTSFGTARNLLAAWEVDLMFLGYRVADSYAHNHYSSGGDPTYRESLLEQIDDEIRYLANQAEVFVFGDHGARELDDVFRINRWLIDHGYLEVDIDLDWRDKAVEYGALERDEDVPGEVIPTGAPGVSIDEANSVLIGSDPFSTGLTVLEGATETALEDAIAELNDEPAIKEVRWTDEMFGPGRLVDECPDLYATRADGWFVSGNLHPEPGGAEVTRSGVHHRIGAWATDDDEMPVPDEHIRPEELYEAITYGFLDLDPDELDVEQPERRAPEDVDRLEVQERLADLGYL